jgi:hypothetical protein
MPNTKDLTIDLGKASFLLIGDNGSGKTYFFREMPKPWVADFDGGVASLRGCDIEYDMFKDAPPGRKPLSSQPGIYKFGDAYPRFLDRLNEIGKQMDEGNCPYQSLGMDSITTLTQICMNAVLARDSKAGKNPEIQHWGVYMRDMQTLLDQFTSWPLLKVCTAHVERGKNPITEATELLVLANGKLQALVPIYFDEVYFCEVESERVDGKQVNKYMLVTKKDALYKSARSRWGVPNKTPLSWTEVERQIRISAGMSQAIDLRRELGVSPRRTPASSSSPS